MNEYLLVFRRDYKTTNIQPTTANMQDHLARWEAFFASIREKIARPIQRFDPSGKVITKDNGVTDGPYAEGSQSIGGLVIINAANYNEAAAIARTCPILELGGTIEIRQRVSSY